MTCAYGISMAYACLLVAKVMLVGVRTLHTIVLQSFSSARLLLEHGFPFFLSIRLFPLNYPGVMLPPPFPYSPTGPAISCLLILRRSKEHFDMKRPYRLTRQRSAHLRNNEKLKLALLDKDMAKEPVDTNNLNATIFTYTLIYSKT
jgi:hypothetical protein